MLGIKLNMHDGLQLVTKAESLMNVSNIEVNCISLKQWLAVSEAMLVISVSCIQAMGCSY